MTKKKLVYVYLQEPELATVVRTEDLTDKLLSPDHIFADYAEDGTLIGIEVLGAIHVEVEDEP